MNNMNKCRIPFQNAETKILLKKSKTKKKNMKNTIYSASPTNWLRTYRSFYVGYQVIQGHGKMFWIRTIGIKSRLSWVTMYFLACKARMFHKYYFLKLFPKGTLVKSQGRQQLYNNNISEIKQIHQSKLKKCYFISCKGYFLGKELLIAETNLF